MTETVENNPTGNASANPTTNSQASGSTSPATGSGAMEHSWHIVPKPMRAVPGNTEKWQAFEEAFRDFSLLDGLLRAAPQIQMAKFRSIFGEDNRNIIRDVDISEIDGDQADPTGKTLCKQLEQTLTALKKRFSAHRNILYQRFVLYRSRQLATETTKDFYSRLDRQIKKCNFREDAKSIQRDILILGTRHVQAQEICFKEDLSKLDIHRTLQIIEMVDDNEKTLKHIAENQQPDEQADVVRSRYNTNNSKQSNRQCSNCGTTHPPRRCPAFNQTCRTCQKRGHFTIVCRSSNRRQGIPKRAANINAVDDGGNSTEMESWSAEEDIYAINNTHSQSVRQSGNSASTSTFSTTHRRSFSDSMHFFFSQRPPTIAFELNTFAIHF